MSKAWLEENMIAVVANPDAQADSQNRYNTCQFSGFRALPGKLVKSGYGEMSLPKFAEPRNMQDFVRVRAESLPGSPRHEVPDVFITDEVLAEDL